MIPPRDRLPFCDQLCLQNLFHCLSIPHIQQILAVLLLDGKVVIHSQNKYQLTLCSTALLSLLKPVHYTLTYIPLLPPQLIDYIEAPTPFLIGLHSGTFTSNQEEEDLQCLLVHLDYDKVGKVVLLLLICLVIHLFIHLVIHLVIHLFIHLVIHLFT